MERFEDYWRGWEGNHFETVIIRTVTENETRRQLLEQGAADIVDTLTPRRTMPSTRIPISPS